ncbi:MAG: oligosaccharide flippase family protein [Gemmatimonadaceae bacterium]
MPSSLTEPAATARGPSSHRVARNSGLYFLSLALPALAALFLVPVTVRSLGPARFGLLALAWAVAESAGMFDLGLARTTVRFVADAFARGGDRLREIVLGSVVSQLIFGLVAGVVLFAAAPVLAQDVFKIPASAAGEATAMFRALAFQIPVLLAAAALRATLEGAQRFDLSTALRIPGSLASVAIPAFASAAGFSLPAIVWQLFTVRLALLLLSAVVVSRTLLPGSWALPKGLRTIRELFGYSGWVAVSTALGPALGSAERFITGAVVGIAGLGYYTGAAEGATRFLMIPATAFAALLPALAHTEASARRERALAATGAARRQLAALLFPLCLTLFIFAPDILSLWLGPAFGVAAGDALRILSVGVFLGGLAHLPLALLYGAGRPDLPAKIHLAEVVVYLPFVYLLVKGWGITGAGLAWATRCAADLVLYEWACARSLGRAAVTPDETARRRRLAVAASVPLVVFPASAWIAPAAPVIAAVAFAAAFAAYAYIVWSGVLTPAERSAWLGMLPRRLGREHA